MELTFWTEPATRWDSFKEALGARRGCKRQNRTALARLRKVFEEHARRAAGARDGGRARALDAAPLRRPSEPGTAQGQGIDCRARWASAVSFSHSRASRLPRSLSGCFLEEEQRGRRAAPRGPRRQRGRDRVHGLHHARAEPGAAGRPRLLAGPGGRAGLRRSTASSSRRATAATRTTTTTPRATRTRRPTTSWSWTPRATSTSRSRSTRTTSSSTTRGRSSPGDCIPAAGSTAAAGPDRRRDAAVRVPARGGENRPLELEITRAEGGEEAARRAGPLARPALERWPASDRARRRRRRLAARAVAHQQHGHRDLRVLHRARRR